jgi:Fe2+ or Zn2+ uptake regulation protein
MTCDYAERMPPDLHEDVAARLADHDGRYTGSRRDLIQALSDAGRPLTVDEIVERSTRQRPSSVYRNLAVFEAERVVRRLAGIDDVARFELTEPLLGHHHHLACQRCGAMTTSNPHDRTSARRGAHTARTQPRVHGALPRSTRSVSARPARTAQIGPDLQ